MRRGKSRDALRVMIADTAVMDHIRRQWSVVRQFADFRGRAYQIPGGPFLAESGPPEEFYNLPFVLAYGILQQTLDALAAEGHFPESRHLATVMEESRAVLPWQDYPRVFQGKEDRNHLAHRGKLFPREHCRAAVDAVETELRAWGIVVE